VSNASFNNFARGVALVCPVTNTDRNIAIHIKLDDRTATTGVVMADQVKALELTARNAKFDRNRACHPCIVPFLIFHCPFFTFHAILSL